MSNGYYVFKCGCRVPFSKKKLLSKAEIKAIEKERGIKTGLHREKVFCHEHLAGIDYRVFICIECGVEMRLDKQGYVLRCGECRAKLARERSAKLRNPKGDYQKVDAVCPFCGVWHKVRVYHTGTGTKRYFCPDCAHKKIESTKYADEWELFKIDRLDLDFFYSEQRLGKLPYIGRVV